MARQITGETNLGLETDPVTGKLTNKNTTGRPKGAKSRLSQDAIKRLAEKGFDPIDKLIDLFHELNTELEATKTSGARAALQSSKRQILETLMIYSYQKPSRLPGGTVEPITIIAKFGEKDANSGSGNP